jgi:uncharacterized protein DUF2442
MYMQIERIFMLIRTGVRSIDLGHAAQPRYRSRMMRVVAVEARTPFTIWLRYADGVEGVVDLAPLAGGGVFDIWNEAGRFAKVRVDEFGAVSWGDGVELDPDALYMQITGKTPEDLFPNLRGDPGSAAQNQ